MRRAAAAVITVLAFGACTASAEAKGPNVAKVCGAARCITIRGDAAVYELFAWQYLPFSSREAPAPAPYYSIRIHDPSGDIDWVFLYAPSRHAVRIWQSRVPPYQDGVGPYWRTLTREAHSVFARVTRGLRPRRAPQRWPP